MQDKLKQIKHYIENYETNKNDTILNYYRIFDLLESSTIETLLTDIKNKKLKILFHPDLLAYIPEEIKSSFLILSNAVKDMENTFSSVQNKINYDAKLRENRITQTPLKNQQFSKKSDLEKFNSIIKTNIEKYGFKFTNEAINMIINYNNFSGITKTNASRTKADFLGKKKIETILNFFTPKNTKNPNLNSKIINYYSFLINQNYELKEKYDIYIHSCEKTICKYGVEQLKFAVDTTLNDVYYNSEQTKFYTGFTNEGNARTKLREHIKPEDIVLLSRIYLNINRRDKYKDNELSTLSDQQIIADFLNTLQEEIEYQNTSKYHR